jgi:flagellar motor protein MotB
MKSFVFTMLAVILLATGSPVVNAQDKQTSSSAASPAQATAAVPNPDGVTKSDLHRIEGKLSVKIDQATQEQAKATAEQTAQLDAFAKAQAEAQQKVIDQLKAEQQQRAAQAKIDADAKAAYQQKLMMGGSIFLLAFVMLIFALRARKSPNTIAATIPAEATSGKLTAKDFYDRGVNPKDVEAYLLDPRTKESEVSSLMELPNDSLVFEYHARVSKENGRVYGYFEGNGDVPTVMENQKLRRTAKLLYDQGVLKPVQSEADSPQLVRAS